MIGNAPFFFFQLPCSWGALYKASAWKIFLEYYALRKMTSVNPDIPGSKSNLWLKSWKRYFSKSNLIFTKFDNRPLIELMLINGWYMLYPNNPNCASFSTNYFEKGVHTQPEDSAELYPDSINAGDRRFTVPLMHNLPKGLPRDLSISGTPFIDLYHLLSSENLLQLEKSQCLELFSFYDCNL